MTNASPEPAPEHVPAPPPQYPGALAGAEGDVQQLGFVWLGAVLLIAFFLPVYAGRFLMLNILELSEKGGPALIKVLAIYPVLAGIATLALARTAKGVNRSLPVLAMGLLVLILFYASPEIREDFRGGSVPPAGLGGFIIILGMIGTFAGSRACSLRPASRLAATVGAVGAGLYLLGLILPTQPKLGSIPLAAPFVLIFSFSEHFGGAFLVIVLALMSLAGMGLMIGASVLCLLNATPREDAGPRAQTAFRLWIWSLVVLVAMSLVPLVWAVFSGPFSATGLFSALSLIIKMDLHVFGLFFLILLGAAGLIADLPERQPA
jgi:hypothetical protein